MANLSSYSRDAMVNHITGDTAFTMPATPYVALFTANTGLDTNAPSAEVSGGSYARETVAFSTSSGGAGANSNSAQISFTQATANWGTITHVAIVDAVTAGNVLLWDALAASRTINQDDQLVFDAGEIDATAA